MPLPGSNLLHPRFHEELRKSAVGDRGLPDDCVITRASTEPGTTDANGNWTPADPDTIYTNGARAQAMPTADTTVVVGDKLVTLHGYRVGIEAAADQVLVDDIVTITSSGDPHLANRPLIVRDVHYDTFLVRRLLLCDDHPEIPTADLT